MKQKQQKKWYLLLRHWFIKLCATSETYASFQFPYKQTRWHCLMQNNTWLERLLFKYMFFYCHQISRLNFRWWPASGNSSSTNCRKRELYNSKQNNAVDIKYQKIRSYQYYLMMMMKIMMMMMTNKNQIKQRYNTLLDAAIYIKCIDTRISGSMKFIKNSQRKERWRGNTERGGNMRRYTKEKRNDILL